MDIGSLIVSLIGGAAGGNGVGAIMKDQSLGTVGNSVAGGAGGLILGAIVQVVVPALSTLAQGGTVNWGSIVSQLIAGGVGGALVTLLVSWIRSSMTKKA
jgi:hypothetical protein